MLDIFWWWVVTIDFFKESIIRQKSSLLVRYSYIIVIQSNLDVFDFLSHQLLLLYKTACSDVMKRFNQQVLLATSIWQVICFSERESGSINSFLQIYFLIISHSRYDLLFASQKDLPFSFQEIQMQMWNISFGMATYRWKIIIGIFYDNLTCI